MKKIFNIAVLLFVSVLVYGQSMVMSHSNKVLPYTVTNNLGGVSLGDEMIFNGTFETSDGGWNIFGSTGFARANEELQYTAAAGVAYVYQPTASMISTVAAETDYRLTFTLTGGPISLTIQDASTAVTYVANDTYNAGSIVIDFTTTTSAGSDGFLFTCPSGSDNAVIDNISLKERL